jgi:hypothetical protein
MGRRSMAWQLPVFAQRIILSTGIVLGLTHGEEALAQNPQEQTSTQAGTRVTVKSQPDNPEGNTQLEKDALKEIRESTRKEFRGAGSATFATRENHPQLHAALDRIELRAAEVLPAMGMDLPSRPKLIVFDHPDMNGTHTKLRGMGGPYIVVTSGAIQKSTPEELDAFLAHEYGHAALEKDSSSKFKHYNEVKVDAYLTDLLVKKKITSEQYVAYKDELDADALSGLLTCNPKANQSFLAKSAADSNTRFLQSEIKNLMTSEEFHAANPSEQGKMLSATIASTQKVLAIVEDTMRMPKDHPSDADRAVLSALPVKGLPGCKVSGGKER